MVSGARGGLGGTSGLCVAGRFQDSAMLKGVLARIHDGAGDI